MKGNGADTDSGSGRVGSESSVSHVDFNAEFARLKVLRAEATEKDFEFALSRANKRFGIAKTKLRNWVDEVEGEQTEQSDGEALSLPVEGAQALVDDLKPDLFIERGNLPAAVYALRDAFVKAGELYER